MKKKNINLFSDAKMLHFKCPRVRSTSDVKNTFFVNPFDRGEKNYFLPEKQRRRNGE